MNHSDSAFLHKLKAEHTIRVWDQDIVGVDFYTSKSLALSELDFNQDLCGARDLVPAPKVVLDLGANVGIFSVLMAKTYGAKVFAVEAASHNAENLALTAMKNGVSDLVVPVLACVAARRGPLVLYQHPLNSGSCSRDNGPPYPSVEVEGLPLDEIWEALRLEQVDFMKVDIEGSEYEIFETFTQWDRVKKIGIEIHAYASDPSKTDEKSEELYHLLASKIGPENVCAQLEHCTYRYGVHMPRERWKQEDVEKMGIRDL